MSDNESRADEERAERKSDGAIPQNNPYCSCEPKRCLAVAGVALAAVAVALLVGAIRRSHQDKAEQTDSPETANCRARRGQEERKI